jgi:acyl-coenzyme A synthetase/AMP-(fatty) acid ligase
LKLLEDYQCENFLFAEDSPSSRKVVDGIQHQAKLDIVAVPTLDYFLHPSSDVPHYPNTATFDGAKFQPFVAMHTSGTTGIPKPIIVPQGVMTSLDASQKVPSMYGLHTASEYWRGLRSFLPFPLFRKRPLFLAPISETNSQF